MKKAGAATPSANRISLWRDADGDGVAETHAVFLDRLNSPFGMALVGGHLYVANSDALVRVPYVAGALRAASVPEKIADLPAGPRNHHWTKGLVASRDGRRLYVTVGSNSNVAEHGMQEEVERAAILEVRLDGSGRRVFASGLRNPNGLAWEPVTGRLWTTVNERDEIGSDLVPDYMTSVRDGGFYGWPWSSFGQHVDVRAQPPPFSFATKRAFCRLWVAWPAIGFPVPGVLSAPTCAPIPLTRTTLQGPAQDPQS